ncbi:MAG TPA: hypothetical protein VLV15_04085, partial [Dongiaceae bacterium]|nr:hypothetical protein [Dongiaceae bacterium]
MAVRPSGGGIADAAPPQPARRVTRRPADPTDVAIAAALVAVAVSLRLWHIGAGLPGFTDEALPVRIGLAMRSLATGAVNPDPRAFGIPSLAVYLHLVVQQGVYLAGLVRGAWA